MKRILKLIVTLIVIMLPSDLIAKAGKGAHKKVALAQDEKSDADQAATQDAGNAQKNDQKNDQAKNDQGKNDQAVKAHHHTSARDRKKKIFTANAGIGFLNAPGFSGQIGFFIKPNLLLEAGGFYGDYSFFGQGMNYMEGQADLKYFFMNSLYARLGGGYGIIQASHNLSIFNNKQAWTESEPLGHGFIGFGNQWQWRNFTMGIEWLNLGYQVPLDNITRKIPLDSTGYPIASSEDVKSSSIPGKDGGFVPSGSFFLGFSF